MLKVAQVSKAFHNSAILNNINFSVEKGSIIGLAGPSGGGKSTLLRCIQKLETIDSGTIECQGTTGFMFQDFQLFPHMTVMENLIYAPKLLDKKTDHTIKAKEILDDLGLLDKANEYPHKLSGGQKQRAALARSLMMHPDLLLCDEPTSGLDMVTILDVVELLEAVRKKGITMIIASHDLDFLTKIADRIIFLKSGQIVEELDPKSIDNPVEHLRVYY